MKLIYLRRPKITREKEINEMTICENTLEQVIISELQQKGYKKFYMVLILTEIIMKSFCRITLKNLSIGLILELMKELLQKLTKP